MHPFDLDLAFIMKNPSHLTVNISESWSINDVPNGGYLMAILANAMLQQSEKNLTPIITAYFISRCFPGKADLSIEKIASSKQFVRFQASVNQEGNERIRAFGTFADKNVNCSINRYEADAPKLAPLEKCVEIPFFPKYSLFRHMDVRLDPGCAGWMDGHLVNESTNKGWIRFRDARHYDAPAIMLIADSFPPAVFASQGMVAWVPTLEFSISIRNRPASEWLQCIFRTRFITCGLLEEDGEIWDENGALIAISRQIAQYRPNLVGGDHPPTEHFVLVR